MAQTAVTVHGSDKILRPGICRQIPGLILSLLYSDTDKHFEPVSETDAQDIEKSLNGDENAFAKLVKRYQDRVAARMWKFTRDPCVLEQLVQDVFVEMYFSLSSFRGDSSLITWLMTIAVRVGYRHFKKQRKSRYQSSFLENLEQRVSSSEADTEKITPSETAELIYGLLEQLHPKERLVLTLIYFSECSIADISRATGWSQAGIKMRAYRARKKIRKHIQTSGLKESIQWICQNI